MLRRGMHIDALNETGSALHFDSMVPPYSTVLRGQLGLQSHRRLDSSMKSGQVTSASNPKGPHHVADRKHKREASHFAYAADITRAGERFVRNLQSKAMFPRELLGVCMADNRTAPCWRLSWLARIVGRLHGMLSRFRSHDARVEYVHSPPSIHRILAIERPLCVAKMRQRKGEMRLGTFRNG
jgi:hypothetical protein